MPDMGGARCGSVRFWRIALGGWEQWRVASEEWRGSPWPLWDRGKRAGEQDTDRTEARQEKRNTEGTEGGAQRLRSRYSRCGGIPTPRFFGKEAASWLKQRTG